MTPPLNMRELYVVFMHFILPCFVLPFLTFRFVIFRVSWTLSQKWVIRIAWVSTALWCGRVCALCWNIAPTARCTMSWHRIPLNWIGHACSDGTLTPWKAFPICTISHRVFCIAISNQKTYWYVFVLVSFCSLSSSMKQTWSKSLTLARLVMQFVALNWH
jgi:hypothetical protein